MKKIILSVFLLLAATAVAFAQPRAVGARVGYNFEASYQHDLFANNMIELTAGTTNFWNGWGYAEVNGVFDWVFNIHGGWNWYVGPGAGLGIGYGHNWHDIADVNFPFRLNVGGQVGCEYQFDFPLNLSLDWRPMLNLFGLANKYYPVYYGFFNFAVGVRYRFN